MRHIVTAFILLPVLPVLPVFPFLPVLSAQTPAPNVQRFISVNDSVVALTHVRVVDGTGIRPLDDQTVVISGGKITAVQPARAAHVPAGAKVMDLKGHTVITGIVGLHD